MARAEIGVCQNLVRSLAEYLADDSGGRNVEELGEALTFFWERSCGSDGDGHAATAGVVGRIVFPGEFMAVAQLLVVTQGSDRWAAGAPGGWVR